MLRFRHLLYALNILILKLVLVTWCKPNESQPYKDYNTIMSNKLELLSQNEKFILNLMDYVDAMQERIEVVEKLTKHLKQPLQLSKGREKDFLSNPLNVFSLVRQSQSDWTQVLGLMEQPVGEAQINYMREIHEKRPKVENVRDSIAAIHRIKEVYKQKAWDLSRGFMDGVQYNAKLSVLDCYELGYLYYNATQFHRAEEWLLTARELMYRTPSDLYPIFGVASSDISSLLARTYTAMGNFSPAYEVLLNDPQLSAAADDWLDYFKANLPQKVENEQLGEFKEPHIRLCSSKHQPNSSRLLCSYKTTPSPFLHLAPFKMEQISLDPYVAVFHDVVYSSEISVLQQVTEPLLERTLVTLETNAHQVSNERTVSGVWLPNHRLSNGDNELVHIIRQRIKDMTGLILDDPTHSQLQLLNYGFGGHYGLHNDFMNLTHTMYNDCIVTVLIYLNDVDSGGATIFPELNLAVKPERGKVLLWYNMQRGSYDFDTRSLHAACPVILGHKLVMTQWINEADQLFVRPCWKPPMLRKFE